MFNDMWNPNQLEIHNWAYSKKRIPHQNWKCIMSNFNNLHIIYEFANNPQCPKQKFFLECLYLLVGQMIISNQQNEIANFLTFLTRIFTPFKEKQVQDWIQRSLLLIENPQYYQNEQWKYYYYFFPKVK